MKTVKCKECGKAFQVTDDQPWKYPHWKCRGCMAQLYSEFAIEPTPKTMPWAMTIAILGFLMLSLVVMIHLMNVQIAEHNEKTERLEKQVQACQ